METENAKITGTLLGYEDHGIFTCMIFVEYGGNGGQGFGGYALGGDYTNKWIEGVLKTVGVEKWEDLKGKHIRIVRKDWSSPIKKIGHIIEDVWFEPPKE